MSGQESYHVRVRGNVLGPFRRDQLLKMIDRGQLTRMHEVSCNGGVWQPAGNFPELFPQQSPPASAQPVEEAVSTISAGTTSPPSQQIPEVAWWYERDGRENGPVQASELKQLIAQGIIGPDNQVWREGMTEWQPIRATELAIFLPSRPVSISSANYAPVTASAPAGDLPPMTVQILMDIRLWSGIFAGVSAIICAVVLLLCFVALLAVDIADARVSAVLTAIHFGLWLIPCIYLLNASISIRELKYTPSLIVLEKVLKRWRTYYLWAGIVVLVTCGLGAIGVIAALAAAGGRY